MTATRRVTGREPSTATRTDENPDIRLRGRLGVVGLLLTVLAFNGPLAIVVGYAPVIIGYGNGLGAPVAFLAAALLVGVFAAGFVKMAQHIENPGGFYAFVTSGLGRELGLGSSFLALVCYYSILLAAFAFGGLALDGWVAGTLNGPEIPWWVWALVLQALVAVLGYFNLDLSAKVLGTLLALEAVVIVVYDIVVIAKSGASEGGLTGASFLPENVFSGGLGIAILFGLLCMGGFEATVIFRDEVRDPSRTIPRTVLAFVCVVGLGFALSTWVIIQALGEGNAVAMAAADPTGSFLGTADKYVGTIAVDLVTTLLCTSLFAAALATHNVLARYLFSLGVDGILPRAVAAVHESHGSPHRASMLACFASLCGLVIFALFGADPALLYAQLSGVFGYALIMLLALTSAAILAYMTRHRPPDTTIWHRVIAPGIGLVGFAVAIWLASSNITLLITAGRPTVVAMFVILYGSVVAGALLAVWLKGRRPEVYARIGRQ